MYHYFVPVQGHIAWFTHYHEAQEFAWDFGGHVWNLWGLDHAQVAW